MDNPAYICLGCLYGFDQDFLDRGTTPICPECGSDEVLPYDEFQENERINAEEVELESWREQ